MPASEALALRHLDFVETSARGEVTPGLTGHGPLQLVALPEAFAEALRQTLGARGIETRVADAATAEPGALLFGHGLDPESGLDAHFAALETVRSLVRGLAEQGGLVVILQDTRGDYAPRSLSNAWSSGLPGLARTLARECPNVAVRVIDVALVDMGSEHAASRLANELLEGGTAPTVGLRPDMRLAPLETRMNAFEDADWITAEDTVLVTGGARGVTADCIIALAERSKARFALLGRSEPAPWPDGIATGLSERELRTALAAKAKADGQSISLKELNAKARGVVAGAEIRATLEQIEAVGGTARYYACDVSQRGALAPVLGRIEADLGPVTALVHGAGVLADKMIADKTRDQAERVFAPKVAGLQHVLDAVDPAKLRAVALFSSVAARYGNAGQADYAMANEVLNRVARALKLSHPDACITSLNWGPWDGGMVDETLRAKFAEDGIDLIGRNDGAGIFADAMMAGPACPVELIIGAALPDA